MNSKTAKLLRKTARILKLRYRKLKKGFSSLPWTKKAKHRSNLEKALDYK